MAHAEGARAILDDLPRARTQTVTVPLEAGDDAGTGISRFSSLQLIRERLGDTLGDMEGPVITIGGDCAVSTAAVGHAAREAVAGEEGGMALVWLDAHPDLNSPAHSPSGAFAGMVLRDLIDADIVPASHVVVAGARSWDAEERAFADAHGVRALTVDELADPSALVDAVTGSGAKSVYVHVDLDVLDPAELDGLLDPEPFGLTADALIAAIRSLVTSLPLAGATIAGYAPRSEEGRVNDASTLLRLVGVLSTTPGPR